MAAEAADRTSDADQTRRLDRWLWFARFFKTRSLATRLCQRGRVRVNKVRVTKAPHPLRVGDVLTFPQGRRIRVVRVLALGSRRGSAAEALGLYEDLTAEASVADGEG